MKPTLVVLAAGIGSRYGGLKQLDRLGPSGETIVEYSVYDAIKAGFEKVVFVIRKDIEPDFKAVYHDKISKHVKVEYAYQELDLIPEKFKVPANREKPWGTGHAVLVTKDLINEPFAVINADDFYGQESYQVLYHFLSQIERSDKENWAMVGYQLENTLSEHGYVSRGVCSINYSGYLETVVERTHIEKKDGNIFFKDESDKRVELTGEEIVSMNMWGFTPSFFHYAEQLFEEFLDENIVKLKSEFYIPFVVNTLIHSGTIRLKVLNSEAKWFGVTYKEDRDHVVQQINKLTGQGVYPANLWK